MNNHETLPCPFCGGTDVTVEEGDTFRWLVAICQGCGAQAPDVRKQTSGPGDPTEWMVVGIADAMKEWNKRV